jgi:hypothetical protein
VGSSLDISDYRGVLTLATCRSWQRYREGASESKTTLSEIQLKDILLSHIKKLWLSVPPGSTDPGDLFFPLEEQTHQPTRFPTMSWRLSLKPCGYPVPHSFQSINPGSLIVAATPQPSTVSEYKDRPSLHSWADAGRPWRLVEQSVPKDTPDPKALACYGLLVRWQPTAAPPRRKSGCVLWRVAPSVG